MEEKEVKVDNLKINYLREGRGEVVIILHGWKSSATAFLEPIGLLAESGFEIIVPDLPGFGKSSPPKVAFSVDAYVYFVSEFAKTLGLKKFFLIGHSFGGRIAIKFAYKYPEKLSGLVLCSAAGIRSRFSLKRSVFFILAKIGNIFFLIPPLRYFRNLSRRAMYFFVGEHDYLAAGDLKETFKKVISEDLTGYLGLIKVPTFILWGLKDRETPVDLAYKMVKKIPKAQLVVIEASGHKLPYENSKEFSKHVAAFFKSLRQ